LKRGGGKSAFFKSSGIGGGGEEEKNQGVQNTILSKTQPRGKGARVEKRKMA